MADDEGGVAAALASAAVTRPTDAQMHKAATRRRKAGKEGFMGAKLGERRWGAIKNEGRAKDEGRIYSTAKSARISKGNSGGGQRQMCSMTNDDLRMTKGAEVGGQGENSILKWRVMHENSAPSRFRSRFSTQRPRLVQNPLTVRD